MSLNSKVMDSLSKLEPFKRYQYVLKRIADLEALWSIVDTNGDLGTSSIETDSGSKKLVPFWAEEEFIKNTLVGNWEKHTPIQISLDDFEETTMSIILENEYLINVFPIDNKTGFVVNIHEFIRDLNEELEQFE